LNSPIRGLFDSLDALETKIRRLENQGGVDLSEYATDSELAAGLAGKSDTTHTHNDYVTDSELAAGLAGKSDTTHTHSGFGVVQGMHIFDNMTAPFVTSGTAKQAVIGLGGITNVLTGKLVVHLSLPMYNDQNTQPNVVVSVNVGFAQEKVVGQYFLNMAIRTVVHFGASIPFIGLPGGNQSFTVYVTPYTGLWRVNDELTARVPHLWVEHFSL
jgi:hypothetical protein